MATLLIEARSVPYSSSLRWLGGACTAEEKRIAGRGNDALPRLQHAHVKAESTLLRCAGLLVAADAHVSLIQQSVRETKKRSITANN
jgi:hypothetical protein